MSCGPVVCHNKQGASAIRHYDSSCWTLQAALEEARLQFAWQQEIKRPAGLLPQRDDVGTCPTSPGKREAMQNSLEQLQGENAVLRRTISHKDTELQRLCRSAVIALQPVAFLVLAVLTSCDTTQAQCLVHC